MKNELLTEESTQEIKTAKTKKYSPLKRVLALAAIGAIGAGVAVDTAACGGNAQPQPKATKTELASPTATTSAEVLPSPSATPEKAPTQQEVDQYASWAEKYSGMGVDEFEALPRAERLAYAQYLMDYTVVHKVYDATYGKYSANLAYKITPVPASLDNTGQEIINDRLYAEQLADIQLQEPADTPTFDATKGREVLSAVYYDVGDNIIVTRAYSDNVKQQETFVRPTESMTKWTATNTSELQTGTNEQGDKVQYKIVTFVTQDGETVYDKMVFQTFTSYDGTQKSIWLLDAQQTDKAHGGDGIDGLKGLGSIK